MNYPCPRELTYLSDGASNLPEESPAFSNAAGAYILECVVPCWELVVSRSARFGGNYEFRPGWETKPGLMLCACPMQLFAPL